MQKLKPSDKRALDMRLVLYKRDADLADYIKRVGQQNRRAPREQIIYMLEFAAAQMSANDQEPKGGMS